MLVVCTVLWCFTVEGKWTYAILRISMCISDSGLFTVTKPQSHNNVKGPVISERDFSTAPPSAVTAAAGSGYN